MAGSPPRQAVRIQSLARANGILEAVAAAPKGSASLTEISQALGLNKTTVFNLAASLVALGFLERGRGPGRLSPGHAQSRAGKRRPPRAWTSATSQGRPCSRSARRPARRPISLCPTCRPPSSSTASRAGMRCARPPMPGRPRPIIPPPAARRSWPISRRRCERRFATPIRPVAHTPQTITDVAVLERQLERVRRQGYASETEENEAGQACIAAPIFDGFGEVAAAISVAGPLGRIAEARAEIIRIVVMHTKAISVQLGAPRPTEQELLDGYPPRRSSPGRPWRPAGSLP